MDEFGVLVESIGFRAGGKSTPMAHLKSNPKSNFNFSNGFPHNIGTSSMNSSKSSLHNDFALEDLDGIFRPKSNNQEHHEKTPNYFDDSSDFFGPSFSDLKPPPSATEKSVGLNSTFDFNNSNTKLSSNFCDDLLTAPPKTGDAIDDFLGKLGQKSSSFEGNTEVSGSQFDELISGFDVRRPPSNGSPNYGTKSERNGQPSSGHTSKSGFSLGDDPFATFESSKCTGNNSSWPFFDPLEPHTGQNSVQSSIDELEMFARVKVQDDASDKHGAVPTTQDPIIDSLFNRRRVSEVKQSPSTTSYGNQKSWSAMTFSDDFPSLFEEFPTSEFKEMEGESEERRRARLNHHMRTQERMAKALAEKCQRDRQTQHEQEEKHRLTETLGVNIKRWAAGKEGNLRAMLSSLQDVLWPECGWKPVSLVDLITSASVNKVYRKATLCIHPDKVQQKGANLQQKYIAEKVFDILKEAYNKFNAEELR